MLDNSNKPLYKITFLGYKESAHYIALSKLKSMVSLIKEKNYNYIDSAPFVFIDGICEYQKGNVERWFNSYGGIYTTEITDKSEPDPIEERVREFFLSPNSRHCPRCLGTDLNEFSGLFGLFSSTSCNRCGWSSR